MRLKTQFIFGGYLIGGFRRGYEKQKAVGCKQAGKSKAATNNLPCNAIPQPQKNRKYLIYIQLAGLIFKDYDDQYICKVEKTLKMQCM